LKVIVIGQIIFSYSEHDFLVGKNNNNERSDLKKEKAR
jgi:hypothetical protein